MHDGIIVRLDGKIRGREARLFIAGRFNEPDGALLITDSNESVGCSTCKYMNDHGRDCSLTVTRCHTIWCNRMGIGVYVLYSAVKVCTLDSEGYRWEVQGAGTMN